MNKAELTRNRTCSIPGPVLSATLLEFLTPSQGSPPLHWGFEDIHMKQSLSKQ